MNKTPRYLLMLLVVSALVVILTPLAHATCPPPSQVVFHGLGGRFVDCAEGPGLQGSIRSLADPGTVSNNLVPTGAALDVLCEEFPGVTSAGGSCQPEAGGPADGNVTVQFDWVLNAAGCPNPSGTGNGSNPIEINVVDNNGDTLTLITGYSVLFAGYIVDAAQPANVGATQGLDVACAPGGVSRAGGPALVNVIDLNPAVRLVDLIVPAPDQAQGIYTDCDAGSLGLAPATFPSTCGPGRAGTLGRGNVFWKIASCSATTDIAFRTLSNGWTLAATSPPGSLTNQSTGAVRIQVAPIQLVGNCAADPGPGPPVCTAPPSRSGDSPCTLNSDCDGLPGDDCRWVGATYLNNSAVSGTCAPGVCDVTDFQGFCGTVFAGFCDISFAGCVTDDDCITGTCSGGTTNCFCDPGGASGSCADPVCPGVCSSGNVGGSCAVDADCNLPAPQSAAVMHGLFTIAGPTAASDRAVLRHAELGKNLLSVRFDVSLEDKAVSFDVLSNGRVISLRSIAADGRGSYEVSVKVKASGKLSPGDPIVIQTNLVGGGTLQSAPLGLSASAE